MNVIRFWTTDGRGAEPVRLTIRNGKQLAWYRSQQTDEGWHAEGVTYEFDGKRVTRSAFSDGTDCDGRLSREDVSEWDCRTLHNRLEVPLPVWSDSKVSQRDYSAEAAGY
jgi:hypothetical protein